MARDDQRKRYQVMLCASCSHPGGQHRVGKGCVLCACNGWIDGPPGTWSDADTEIALAEARIEAEIAEIDRADDERRLVEFARTLPTLDEQTAAARQIASR